MRGSSATRARTRRALRPGTCPRGAPCAHGRERGEERRSPRSPRSTGRGSGRRRRSGTGSPAGRSARVGENVWFFVGSGPKPDDRAVVRGAHAPVTRCEPSAAARSMVRWSLTVAVRVESDDRVAHGAAGYARGARLGHLRGAHRERVTRRMRDGRVNVRRDMASKRMTIDAGDFDHRLRARSGRASGASACRVRGPRAAAARGASCTSCLRTCARARPCPARSLVRAPGMPKGDRCSATRTADCARCSRDGNCAIYSARPSTCRAFDCRARRRGIADGRRGRAHRLRVRARRFSYCDATLRAPALSRDPQDRRVPADARRAVWTAACRAQPMTLAALAIRVHHVLLEAKRGAQPEIVSADGRSEPRALRNRNALRRQC